MYRIVSYYLNDVAPAFNTHNLFKDFVVCKDNDAESYVVKIQRENRLWKQHLFICQDWGVKIYNENDELIYEAGQFENGWIEPIPYGDQYVDQPDAL